jgi:23S rRNA pseudouridine1911/1915/1917 synthase
MPNELEYLFEYTVTKEDVLERLDKFIVSVYDGLSRTAAQKLLDADLLLINQKPSKASYKVHVGDSIQIVDLLIAEMDLEPENIPLAIVYEDDDVLVIDKPQGMVVHPAPGNYSHTLVNALLYHFSTLGVGHDAMRPGIVHRIDKDTSGLLMVAKTDFALRALQEDLKEHKPLREYVAVVSGIIPHQYGKIDKPIGRDPRDRKRMAVVEDGKPAITHFEVIKQYLNATYIKCRLETGRTHQIRVHLASIGYPVLGDPIYGKKANIAETGQYLHAMTLGFTHPRSGELMTFSTPVPAPFQTLLESFEQPEITE